MNGDFHTDQPLDALYRLNAWDDADVQMLRDSINVMEAEATRLSDAGQQKASKTWKEKANEARLKLGNLLSPRMGG